MSANRISPKELYLLRRAQLEAERKALAADLARQAVKEFLLNLERKYGLLGKEGYVDIHTGSIKEVRDEFDSDARKDSSGPA